MERESITVMACRKNDTPVAHDAGPDDECLCVRVQRLDDNCGRVATNGCSMYPTPEGQAGAVPFIGPRKE
jgi:hypothetical protein